MIKLLNAGFTRLRKNKLFWILIIFSIGLALLMIFTQYDDMKKYGEVIKTEQPMLNYSTLVGVVITIFTSLFLGVEYSDGAIRNKISIGLKRANVYLSNLIITTIASLFSYVLFIIIIAIVGIPIFGGITIHISNLLGLLGCIFVTIIAYSSIFTFIAMIISNKTITAIVSIMLEFGLMMVAVTHLNVITASPVIKSGSITNAETGEMKFTEVPNPRYPTESERKIYQTLLDINPAGQMFQIAGRVTPNLKILPIYSLGIIVIFSGFGIILFNKKELK